MSLYQCSICQEKFLNPTLVIRHQESQHAGQEGKTATLNYQCPSCKLVMGHPASVKNHALVSHGIQRVVPVEVAG